MEKISTGAVEMNEMSVTTLIIRQRGEQLFTTSVAADPGFGRLNFKPTSLAKERIESFAVAIPRTNVIALNRRLEVAA